MTVNPPVVKLCVNCRHLVGGNCEHPSNMRFSYVDGKMGTHNTADYLRREDKRGDGSLVCGPTGRFHERAPDPNAYAEAMIRRDQTERHTGRPEHDTDIVGRALKAGM